MAAELTEESHYRLRVRYEAVLELERPAVEEVREELDGGRFPVRSYERAVEWIEHCRERLDRGEFGPIKTQTQYWVEYWPRDKSAPDPAPAPEGSPLYPIGRLAARLGQEYGLRNRTVVAFVLTDKLRFVPKAWRIETDLLRREDYRVQVTFFSPHITREELINLHSHLRSFWGAKNQKLIGQEDESLIDAIREAGGLPIEYGEVGAFWESVAQQIGAPSGRAARMRAERLNERLKLQV